MSTIDAAATAHTTEREGGPLETERPDPQPWRSPEDRKGWRTLPRPRRGAGELPLIGVEVEFDRAQSEWLRREAARTGLDYVELVRRLVDEVRASR